MVFSFKPLAFVVILLMPIVASTQEVDIYAPEHYIKSRYTDSNGKEVVQIVVPGKKPEHLRMPVAQKAAGDVLLNNVPAYDWSFGCSATSAAMMAGYYDITSYPAIYTGPSNGGIAPMDNSSWGTAVINGETRSLCPLSATRLGLDGRSTRGHADDYWIMYGNDDPDPYISNGWTQHAYGDCTGDFMKTNQSAFGNSDGSTIYTFFVDGGPYGEVNDGDGNYGLKLFFESRGCTVTGFYNQYIQGYNGLVNGFTFGDYTQMIDLGMPVLIQVAGHTMLGLGYNLSGNKVLLHDTWDYSLHEMTWGGSYTGMQHYAVSVIAFPCQPFSSMNEDFSSFGFPTCWQQSHSGAIATNRWSLSASSNAGGSAYEMRSDWTEGIGTSRLMSAPLNTTGASAVNLSFKTFFDDYGTGATLKIQSSSDLINWTDEAWSYPTGSGDITAGTTINTQVIHNLGGTTYIAWVIEGDHYQYDNWFIDDVIIDIPASKQLQLSLFLEGLFNGVNMNKASNGTGYQFGGNIADQITVELHQAANPHAIVGTPITTSISTAGNATLPIPSSSSGSYYIVIKHRNSIETWSAAPVSFSGSAISYNFTSAANKAFGNNMKQVSGKYAIFGGDVNQDGLLDSGDMTPIDNLVSSFGSGYFPEDANGDGLMDSSDLTIVDNNATAFISVIKP
jgi:hypothetical protein